MSGADIVSSHAGVREQPYALAVAQIGSEAVLKLFPEPEPHPRVFDGLVRFLDLLDRGIDDGPDPVRDGVGLGFQLKLLALAGYLPHLDSCAGCGSAGALVGYSAGGRRAPSAGRARPRTGVSPELRASLETHRSARRPAARGRAARRGPAAGRGQGGRGDLRVPRRLPPAHAARLSPSGGPRG